MKVTVDLSDLRVLTVRLGRLAQRDPSELTAMLGRKTLEQTAERYGARRAPDGSRWAPRKDRLPHPLLEKTGRQRGAIQLREIQTHDVAIGTAGVPYAGFHMTGTSRMPARPFLGWGARDVDELSDTAEEWLAGTVADEVL